MKALLTDKDNKLSLGRLFLMFLLILATAKFWYFGIEIPATMATVLMSLLGYELGKKGRDAYLKKTKRRVGANPS